ncbi:NADPH-dependent FMN reductase [Engelhardtia mirabilis]|uniref:FMN-dependent NADPH-azoreductase n=1 Tax=Engelhardtia mirabilis TaxID=2528011 RepID=A0A518BRD0_9BACT|nr:FMN-dependent NADPH-azoreductase [Planctomycetes bacterium Pla133]QDV03868.1 FMN-dependent NADPH-azoreductase [Planctomycetes bacterium Pla86]
MTVRILAFSGSLRAASLNHRLVEAAAASARAAGAEVTVASLRDFEIPLYDGDDEDAEGMPEGARRFKALMAQSDGFLIASPEYNGGYSGALKNVIDWASRTESAGEAPLVAFRGKTAGLLAASPGRLGGVRGLAQLNTILSGLGVLVLPEMRAFPAAHEIFAEDGSLERDGDQAAVDGLARRLVATCSSLAAG